MFGSAFGVGLGGCLGIIAAVIVVFFLIAFCTAALGGGGGGKNKGASRAYESAELAYAPNREEEDVFHDVRISTRLLEAVMNSISNGLGMQKTEDYGRPSQPDNPHLNAVFTQVHNTL